MAKPDFSVFEVLDIDHEKYYSRVLAWLLNPTGSHRQKDFFRKWLLKTCGVPTKIKYESVGREEWIKGENDAARQFIDIALRCEGYLIYIEVKKDNRSIDKLQPSIQFELGHKLAEGENRQFVYVFLAPDETTPNRVSLPEGTKLITWSKVRDTLREQLHKLENKARQSKTLAEQTIVLDFLRQFIDRQYFCRFYKSASSGGKNAFSEPWEPQFWSEFWSFRCSKRPKCKKCKTTENVILVL